MDFENIEVINKYIEEIQSRLNSGDYMTHWFSEFVKPIEYIHINLPDLNVYLSPIKTNVEGYFYDKDHKDFKAPYILAHNTRIKKNRIVFDENTVAHELKHFVDWKQGQRFKTDYQILKPEGGINPEYYNDPVEINAYMIQFLRAYIQQVKLSRLPEDYQRFYKTFFKSGDVRKFYNYLNSENRKAFDNRLQDFHKKLLERKHDVSNIISEEYQKFIYSIQDLAKILERQGFDEEGQKILESILFDAYRRAGDEGVIETYKEISGVEIQAISRGRYVFHNLYNPETLKENQNQIQGLDYRDDQEGVYSDEFVSGQIRIVGDDVEILDWNSNYKQHGGTEISLKRLKDAYGGEIRAVDCGYEGEPSYEYWQKMLEKGLIDGFYDDDTNLHTL